MRGLDHVPETAEEEYMSQRLLESQALIDDYPDEAKARVYDAVWHYIEHNANTEYGIQSKLAQWLIYAWAVLDDAIEDTVDDSECE